MLVEDVEIQQHSVRGSKTAFGQKCGRNETGLHFKSKVPKLNKSDYQIVRICLYL